MLTTTTRLLRFASLAALLVAPSLAQFGVGNRNRKAGTQFQDLQKAAQDANNKGSMPTTNNNNMDMDDMDMDQLRSMFAGALDDPETQKYLQGMGEQFGAALEQIGQMTPEQMQAQMNEAMQLLTQGDMVDTLVKQRDEIIKTLEASGGIPPEELARYKTDPEYFESTMRESFNQMKGLLTDPDYMKSMTEAMGGMQDLMGAEGDFMKELEDLMSGGDLTDNDKIEQARLELLSGKFSDNPLLKEMMNEQEMQDLLQDPNKWRESVKEGTKNMLGGQGMAGAGVGEL